MKNCNLTWNCQPKVSAVTVTYGDRTVFIDKALACGVAAGIKKYIIVGNGITEDVFNRIRELGVKNGANIIVIRLERNFGSARGYHVGLEAALQDPELDFIWLLDDDNCPRAESFRNLLVAHKKASETYGTENVAVMAVRSDREIWKKIASGEAVEQYFPRNAIYGFHCLESSKRILRRFCESIVHSKNGSNNRKKAEKFETNRHLAPIEIPFAPYGGLLMPRTLVSRIGFPDNRFVLYGDDTEYTSRISANQARLFLVPSSVVDDADRSWHVKGNGRSTPNRLLMTETDFRAFYSFRNETFMAKSHYGQHPMFWLNCGVLLCAILTLSLARRRLSHFRLLRQAFLDGFSGQLGVSPIYPLPNSNGITSSTNAFYSK